MAWHIEHLGQWQGHGEGGGGYSPASSRRLPSDTGRFPGAESCHLELRVGLIFLMKIKQATSSSAFSAKTTSTSSDSSTSHSVEGSGMTAWDVRHAEGVLILFLIGGLAAGGSTSGEDSLMTFSRA